MPYSQINCQFKGPSCSYVFYANLSYNIITLEQLLQNYIYPTAWLFLKQYGYDKKT